MKPSRLVGSLAVALGIVAPHVDAQTAERVAALDPALAPATAPATSASGASSSEPANAPNAAEDGATAPVEPVTAPPPPAATLPKPEPKPLPVSSPLLNGFGTSSRDAVTPSTSELPIRSRRKLALLGEVGWNGLAGFGAVLTYNAHPHVAFDLAGGLSLTGWKAGLRGRYNLLTGPFTPFIGAGLSLSSGLKGARVGGGDRDRSRDHADDFAHFDPTVEGKYDVKSSEFAQAVIGFEFIHRHGFTMQAAAGYSWRLNRNNFELTAGTRHDDLASAFFGSGPVLSTGFGYAFD